MKKTQLHDLSSFLDLLEDEHDLLVIEEEVDPYLEIAEIHRRVIANQGPALMFTKVKNSSFPVVTNLFGTAKRLDLSFGSKPQDFVRDIVNLAETIMPPSLDAAPESPSPKPTPAFDTNRSTGPMFCSTFSTRPTICASSASRASTPQGCCSPAAWTPNRRGFRARPDIYKRLEGSHDRTW